MWTMVSKVICALPTIWKWDGGIVPTPRAAIAPMKVAQIPRVGADFEIVVRGHEILRPFRPWSA
jgi:hypothetical protein